MQRASTTLRAAARRCAPQQQQLAAARTAFRPQRAASVFAASSRSLERNPRFLAQTRGFAFDANDEVHQDIDKRVKEHDILLFMKGNPLFPQCGFSRMVCEVLKREGLEGKFQSVDILAAENQALRDLRVT